ncbi:MAG: hypothetical protein Devi2KO_39800 [Devosia indica]
MSGVVGRKKKKKKEFFAGKILDIIKTKKEDFFYVGKIECGREFGGGRKGGEDLKV